MGKYKKMEHFTGISQEVQKRVVGDLHKAHKTKGDLGVCCELLTVAVSPDFAGKGIASNLSKIVVSEAKKAGFKFLFSEATGEGSKKAMLKCGGEIKDHINYADWTTGKGCFSKGS